MLTVSQGSSTNGTVTVTSVGAANCVSNVSITNPGTVYSVASGVATTGGTGTGAQINPTQFGWVDDTDGNNPTRITLLASNTGAFAGEQVTLADITTPGFTSSGNLKLFAA